NLTSTIKFKAIRSRVFPAKPILILCYLTVRGSLFV
ncbi:hypothetical protein Nmel_009798, partial [Mimus melanotis]